MKRYLTTDDILDIYIKAKQRGVDFVLSKFNLSGIARTKSAFSESKESSANWWSIPYVRERWNKMITGNPTVDYVQFLTTDLLANQKNIRLLSIGSGESYREMELAQHPHFSEITCLDLTPNRMEKAAKTAASRGITNMQFICANVYTHDFGSRQYDYVFFNASLHHFENINSFLKEVITPLIHPKGGLIINEYVGATRLQFSKKQLQHINKGIQLIPKKYRQRFKTKLTKNSYSGSGVMRMVLADPSECVDSESIMPSIQRYFTPEYERAYGGNLLANILKDIAHHFYELDQEKKQLLDALFAMEDDYLKTNPSDFVFGLYRKK